MHCTVQLYWKELKTRVLLRKLTLYFGCPLVVIHTKSICHVTEVMFRSALILYRFYIGLGCEIRKSGGISYITKHFYHFISLYVNKTTDYLRTFTP